MLSNYPEGWQARYVAGKLFAIDPTVIHGLRSQEPVLWSESLFASAPALWDEAQAFGLRVGGAQSSLGAPGPRRMLTLGRSSMPISSSELSANEMKMRWLLSVAHQSMANILAPRHGWQLQSTLTAREVEVLKWTADGKTMTEISDILKLSDNTVKFHIRNAVAKLQTTSKTAAVVRAAMLGWLD
jgi:LuxR family transcriptional regulator